MNDAPIGHTISYDEVAYESYPFAQAHPDRLATIATLIGMTPPRVASARILELGCASGGHLIPLAVTLPNARLVGIDLSSRQIADGLETVRALGLDNIALRHASILEVTPEWGVFDYIICHGVFSWVPDEVRRKIFAICREHLSADGVAYVSYNVYPGWHMRGMLRDMMCYHARRFAEPEKRVQQAQALLDFLSHAASDKAGPYGQLLKRELATLSKKPASYLLHEFLEDVNDPLYFHQFAEQAEAHELQYLGEARLPSLASSNHPRAVQETLARVASNLIEEEQYLDFVRNRVFRETLLCHKAVSVNRRVSPAAVGKLRVAGAFEMPRTPIDCTVAEPAEFVLADGSKVATRDRLAKAAYVLLAQSWPVSIHFNELAALAATVALGGREPGATEIANAASNLTGRLVTLGTRSESLRFTTEPSPCIREVSSQPATSPLTRHESARRNWCVNRLHEPTPLTDEERALVGLLDGSRDHHALHSGLATQGFRLDAPRLEAMLHNFAMRALLVS